MTVQNPDRVSHNTDGVDVECSQNTLVEDVRISTGYDALAVAEAPGGQ